MLLPTSVNAAGSWTKADGTTTTNLETSVDNVPPAGVASANEAANPGASIRSAANSATDNCDLNMATYTSAGVSGTINGVMGVVRNGEDIATGTKTGGIQIISNPTSAGESSITFGNDLGAHGAEAGLWYTEKTIITAGTGITLGISPVLRVGKRTATTRVVCVDFMGIYVDYTPATVTASPRPVQTVLQANNRAATI